MFFLYFNLIRKGMGGCVSLRYVREVDVGDVIVEVEV